MDDHLVDYKMTLLIILKINQCKQDYRLKQNSGKLILLFQKWYFNFA